MPGDAAAPRSWIAAYRLQLHRDFTLADAGNVLPCLARLGISHVYLSPCLQANRGSRHGYDVTDPAHVSDELGGDPLSSLSSVVMLMGRAIRKPCA